MGERLLARGLPGLAVGSAGLSAVTGAAADGDAAKVAAEIDQDIRAGIAEVGDLGTDAAWVAAERMLAGLGRTWARDVGALAGVRGRVTVTGPGVEFGVVVVTDGAGRGRISADDESPVAVAVTMSWPTFAALSSGRSTADVDSVQIVGDDDLGARLISHFNVAP